MSKDITTKFKVDISDLKKNISAANQQIKQAEAEFKNATVGMDNWAKSADGLSAAIDAQTKKVSAEEDKLAALKQEMVRYSAKAAEGERTISDLTRKHQEAAEAFGEDSAEAKKFAKQLAEAKTAQEKNAAAADRLKTDIINQDTAVKNAKNQLDDYRGQLADVENQTGQTDGKTEELNKEIKDTDEQSQKTSSGGLSALGVALGNLAADAIAKCVDGMKQFIAQTVEVGKGFESTMSQVQAISGASAEDMEELSSTASELGRTTSKSAQEVAEGFSYMAMAGWKTEDMLGGINGIVKLSEASQTDLATASDIVTDALTAFGESADQAGRLADIMAAASSNANTNVEMMGETFKYVAPLAGSMGYSMEDISTAIGLMANSGIKATQAGTSLRSLLTRMASPTKESAVAMHELGISLADDEGQMYSFDEVMRQIRAGFGDIKIPIEDFNSEMANLQSQLESGEISEDDFNKAQAELTEKAFGAEGAMKAQYASMLAGKNGLSGLLAIVNASESDFDKLTAAINSSEGAASDMASTMMDNLGGDITLLQSAFEAFQMSVYNNISGPLRDIVQTITSDVMPALEGLVAGADGASEKLGEALGGMLSKALDYIVQALPEIAKVAVPLIEALAEQLVESVPELLQAAADILGTLSSSLGKLLPKLIKSIGKILSDKNNYKIIINAAIDLFMAIVEALPDIINALTEALPDIIVAVIEALQDCAPQLWQAVVTLFTEALPELTIGILSALGNAVVNLVDQLDEVLWQPLMAAMEDFWAWLVEDILTPLWETIQPYVQPIIDGLSALWAEIQTMFESAWSAIQAVWDLVAPYFEALWTTIKDIFSPIVDFFTNLFGKAEKDGIEAKMLPLKKFFSKLWSDIKKVFSGVLSFFKDTFSAAWNGVKVIWDVATAFFKGVWDGIKAVFSVVKNVLSGFFKDAWDSIKAVWNTVVDFYSDIWDGIKDIFRNVGTWFKDKFETAKNNITDVWDTVKGYFSGIWTGVKNVFTGVGTWFKDKFTTAWSNIKAVFDLDTVKKFFGDLWDGIKEKFTNIGSSVGEAVGGAFKKAINWAIDAIEDVLNFLPENVNDVLQDITDLTGVSLPLFPNVSLPRLAKGGIVDKATLAEIGEDGREAVIPLEKNKAGLREIARLMSAENSPNGLNTGGGAGGKTYTFNQTINSPKPVSRYELYRQTKNLIKAAKVGAI